LILTLTTEYGIITYLTKYSQPYSSDEQLLKSFNLDGLSDKEKAWQIYSHVEKLEHKFTYYSFFENPVSIIFEIIIFRPLYQIINGRDSEVLNTLLEPYLIFNAGGGICHQSAIAMVELARKTGLKARVIGLERHGVAEIYYDNAWHLFDADMGVIFKENDHILSYAEIISKPNLLYETLNQKSWKNERTQEVANMYLTTDNNFFLTDRFIISSYETDLKIYYFLTRLLSYFLSLFIFLSLVFFFLKQAHHFTNKSPLRLMNSNNKKKQINDMNHNIN
jgi:hypothetical protein